MIILWLVTIKKPQHGEDVPGPSQEIKRVEEEATDYI
jgi:hypothetical protein